MANEKTYKTLFQIAGELQSSFTSSFSKAEHQFTILESKAKHAAAEIKHSFSHLGETIEKAFAPLHSLAHLTGIGAIVGGGLSLLAGHELLKGGYETRAEREVLQNQLHAILASKGREGEQSSVDSMIRRFSDNEAPVKYEPAMEAVNKLLGADIQKFNNTDKLHATISQLADLSRDENTFGLISNAYTKMQAMHKVDRRHLNEIDLDSGFSVSKEMATLAGMSTDKFAEAMSKHKIGNDKLLSLLDSAISKMTSQGGPAYEHALQQMKGLKGIAVRVEERFRDFKEAVGSVEEAFISPFMESLLSAIGPEQLKHVFDGIMPSVKALGENIKIAFNFLLDTGRFERTGRILQEMFSAFSGGKDADTWSFVRGVTDAWDGLNRGLEGIKGGVLWLKDNLGTVAEAAKLFVGAWAAFQVGMIVVGLWSIATAIWGIGAAATATLVPLLANPITWVIVGVAALAAGLYLLVTHWGEVSAAIQTAWKWLGDFLNKAIDALGLRDLVTQIGNAFNSLKGIVSDLWAIFGPMLTAFAGSVWDTVKSEVGQLVGVFQGLFDFIRTYVLPALGDFAHFNIDQLTNGFTALSGILDGIKTATSWLASTWSGMHAPGTGLEGGGGSSVGGRGVSVQMHARGGIFGFPHFGVVAEAGPEAIIPLNGSDRSMGLLERAAASMGISSGGTRTGHSFTIAPNITLTGDAKPSDLRSIAGQLSDMVRSEIQAMMQEEERLAY